MSADINITAKNTKDITAADVSEGGGYPAVISLPKNIKREKEDASRNRIEIIMRKIRIGRDSLMPGRANEEPRMIAIIIVITIINSELLSV